MSDGGPDAALELQGWLVDLLRPQLVAAFERLTDDLLAKVVGLTVRMKPGIVTSVDDAANRYSVRVVGEDVDTWCKALVPPGVTEGDGCMVIYAPPSGSYIIGPFPT